MSFTISQLIQRIDASGLISAEVVNDFVSNLPPSNSRSMGTACCKCGFVTSVSIGFKQASWLPDLCSHSYLETTC